MPVQTVGSVFSLVLALFSIAPLYLLSKGSAWGWIWGIVVQLPWGIYGCLTHQLGLVLLSFVYIIINLKGLANHHST